MNSLVDMIFHKRISLLIQKKNSDFLAYGIWKKWGWELNRVPLPSLYWTNLIGTRIKSRKYMYYSVKYTINDTNSLD